MQQIQESIMSVEKQIVKALTFTADLAQMYGQLRPHRSAGSISVMRICRSAAQVIETQGASVDDVVSKIRDSHYIAAAKTSPGIPSKMRQGVEDDEDDY